MSAPLRIHDGGDESAPACRVSLPSRAAGKFTFLHDNEIEQLPEPSWLVKGIIPCSSSGVLFGPSGIGKSFVALDLSLSVATGTPFLNRAIAAGPVAYIMAEGDGGLKRRLAAWKHHKGIDRVPNFLCLPRAVDLPDEVESLAASIQEQCLPGPRLVVIDTLARCYSAGDENSAHDMGAFIRAIDVLQCRTGATVLIVHHTGKQGALERGSSALRSAVDTMMALTATPALILGCGKQKEDAWFENIAIRLKPWLNSCVVELETGRQVNDLGVKPQLCLDVLRESGPDGLTHGAWATRCAERGVPSSPFDRVRKALIEKGHVNRNQATRRYSVATGETPRSQPISALPV